MLTAMMPTFVVPVAVFIVVEEVVLLDEEDNLNVLVVVEEVLIVDEAEIIDVIVLEGITEDTSGNPDAIGEAWATQLVVRCRPLI
jgi:hypothetical protein